MYNKQLSRAGWTSTRNPSRVLSAVSTIRQARGGVAAAGHNEPAAGADDANPQLRLQSNVQHCTPLPRRQTVGELLFQQPLQQHPVSLGEALLRQPVIHSQQRPLQPLQQQQQHQQRMEQQQHRQRMEQQQQHQQQLQQRPHAASPHSLSWAPQHPAALSADDGYMVPRRERYMAPQAAELQGQTWSAPSVPDLEAAVAALPPDTIAAAAVKVAANPALTLADVSSSASGMPRRSGLFFALQALVAERQAVSPAAGDADSDTAATHSSSLAKPSKRSGSSSSEGIINRTRRRSSSVSQSKGEANISSQDISAAYSTNSHNPAGRRQSTPTYGSNRNSGNSSSSQRSGRHGYAAAAAYANVDPASHSSSSSRPTGQPSPQGLYAGGAAQQHQLPHRNISISSSGSSHSRHQPGSQVNLQQQAAHLSSCYQQPDKLVLMQLQDTLIDEHGIELQDLRFGQHKAQLCPHCNGGSSQELSLALKITEHAVALWKCHRATCDWSGRFSLPGLRPSSSSSSSSSSSHNGNVGSSHSSSSGVLYSSRPAAAADAWRQGASAQSSPRPVEAHVTRQLQALSSDALTWLQQERGISPAVLRRNKVGMVYRPGHWGPSIAFPYYQGKQVVNIKYRTLDKRFYQVKDGSQVFYGIDDLQGTSEVYIVEGELDKLAIESASGLTAVLSLPGGALPAPKDPNQLPDIDSKKLACVDQAAAQLSQMLRVVIAVDGDGPGWATAVALAHKLQRIREQQQHAGVFVPLQDMQYLPWPAAWNAGDTLERVAHAAEAAGVRVDRAAAAKCKDANDVLRTCGPAFLKLYLQLAPRIPQ